MLVFVAMHGLSLVVAGGATLLGSARAAHCIGFSLQSRGSRRAGLSSWGARAWLVAPQHVRSSWTRGRTCIPCIGRWILNHWTTRDVLVLYSDDVMS